MSADGDAAEQYAADFLFGQGLQLLVRNYRSRFGEIDLIMRDGETLVPVDVIGHSNGGLYDTFNDGKEGNPKTVLSLRGVSKTGQSNPATKA